MKTCKNCGSKFVKRCRACQKAWEQKYKVLNRTEICAKKRAYHHNNRPIISVKKKAYYEKNKETILANRIKRLYSLTPEQYQQLSRSQGDACAICQITPEKLMVDHDHATGKVRGLLCGMCNLAIGYFGDKPETMEAAKRYLESHK